jgi:hypothetical protein
MADIQQKIEDGFSRIRAGLSDGQGQVDAVLSLLKDRVAAEEAYSRALLRLSKQNLALDERVMEPAIFEALASLRGDLANESVQHSELGSSVQRDAVEPLVRLREGGESVHRLISAQARQTMADVKTAVERCKRHYSKYQQLHGKAVIACTAAGIPIPQLMLPASDTGVSSGSASSGSSSGGGSNKLGLSTITPHGSFRNLGIGSSSSSSSSSSSANAIPDIAHASNSAISATSTISATGTTILGSTILPADASSSSATSLQTMTQQTSPMSSSDMFSGLVIDAAHTSSSDAASIGEGEGSGEQVVTVGVSGQVIAAPRSRRASGAGSEFSHNSAENNNVLDSSIAMRIRTMASGFMGTMSVPPTTAVATANANMTAAERIELARSVATAAIQASIEAWAEYLHSWSYLCKAREVCLRQLEASIVIVSDHERKRVTEFSDSLRRYTVFISSMHANLQFDVQRLSGHFEEIASAKATTLTSLSAIRSSEATVAALGSTISSLAESAASSAAAAGAAAGISFAPITTTPITSSFSSGTPLSIFGSYDASSARRMSGFDGTSVDGSSGEGDIQRKESFGALSAPMRRESTSQGNISISQNHSSIVSISNSGSSMNSSKAPGATVIANDSSLTGSSSPQALARMGRSMIAAIPSMALPSSDEAAAAAAAAAASSAAAMKTVAARLLNATSSSSSSSSSFSSSSSSSLNIKGLSNKPASSSPLAPKVGIAIDGFSSAAQAAASSSMSSLSSWGAKFGNALAASASLHSVGHPPRPFASNSKQTAGSNVSMSVSVSGVVRNQGALGAGSKGVSEAAAMFAKLRIENSAIEYFVAALFDPYEKLVKLAPDGASVIAIPPESIDVFDSDSDFNTGGDSAFGDISNSNSRSDIESIPTLSLADFATGRSTPASPTNDSSRSRGGTASPTSDINVTRSRGGTGTGVITTTTTTTTTGIETIPTRSSFDMDNVGGDSVFSAIVPPPLPIRARAETATAGHILRRAVAAGEMNAAVVPLLPQVRKLLKHSPDGLSRFVMGMDARRGEGAQLLRPCFDALASIMKIALDIAELRSAYGEARTLLVISQTLYTVVPANGDVDAVDPKVQAALDSSITPKADGSETSSITSSTIQASVQHRSVGRPTRLYLQMRVRMHPLWQSIQFWETAIFDSIGSEMSKMKSQRSSSTGMRKLTGGGDVTQSPGEREREQDLLLGQLGFFAYQMIDFCVPQDIVKKVLEKYGKFINLDTAHITTLMNSLASFADARRVLDA